MPAPSAAPGEMDVVAAIVAQDGQKIDPHAIFAWCREKAESSMVPSFLMLVPELPKTASEKVQPRFLAQMFAQRSVPIYSE